MEAAFVSPFLTRPRGPAPASRGVCGSASRAPVAAASSSKRKSRRAPRRRAASSPRDPILNDNDVDMTSIKTYVSCPTCANSLMVPPSAFLPDGGPVELGCNVCGGRWKGGIDALETVSGEKFEAEMYLARQREGVNLGEVEKWAAGEGR